MQARALTVRHPAARAAAASALHGVDLGIAAGEALAVIGPSGAGKTSLLLALGAALQPVAGAVQLGGTDPWVLPRPALRRLRGQLCLAPQTPPLPPRQRVLTAVLAARLPALGLAASLRLWLHAGTADIARAQAALAAFDMDTRVFDRVDRLSGGERQRVGLARLLLAPARLWLVDEPLSALDPTRATQALRSLRAAASACGATLVATLHQVDMALAHFPRIVGLRDGRVCFDCAAAQVSPAMLQTLYAQHEDELHGAAALQRAAAADPVEADRTPLVVHCR